MTVEIKTIFYERIFNRGFWFDQKSQVLPLIFSRLDLTQFDTLFILSLRMKYDYNENKNNCVIRTFSIVGFDSIEDHNS